LFVSERKKDMICKLCNSENPDGVKFCSNCGSMLEAAEQKTAPAGGFCAQCGAPLEAGTKFCGVCGASASGNAPVAESVPAPVVAPAPAAESIPAPVAAPAPVSETPAAPTAASMAAVAMNSSVEPANQQSFGGAPAADVSAFSQNVAAETATASSFGTAPSTMSGVGELPAFDMGAAAVAVKPVKKNKKVGKIILFSVIGLVVAAAVVVGLFFRGPVMNLFMGDQGYARMIEQGRINTVMNDESVKTFTANSGKIANTAFSSAYTAYKNNQSTDGYYEDSVDSLSSIAFSGQDIVKMFSENYALFMEMYGVNGAEMTIDADVQLTEAGKSMMGLGDAADEVLSYINDTEIKMAVGATETAEGVEIALTDKSGFTVNARGIICSDGTVAVMFPFGSNKCIKMQLDMQGEVVSSEEVDIDIDSAEVERLTKAMTDIYLDYYNKADVTIENGDLSIGGTDMKASGRLIVTKISPENVGAMLADMLKTAANDPYFRGKVMEMASELEADISDSDYATAIEEAGNAIKDSIPFGVVVKTLVDFNGNVLGGAYGITSVDYGTYNVKYISTGDDFGLAVDVYGMEVVSIIADAKNDTDGTIRMEIYGGTGVNIDYTGVKNEKYFNSEVPVGTYEIYLAGTAASDPITSSLKIKMSSAVEGDSYINKMSVEVAEYGSAALTMTTTPKDMTSLVTIPSDAFDIGNPETASEEKLIEAGKYALEMLEEIQAVCQNNTNSMFAQLLAPVLQESAGSLESLTTPMASAEAMNMLVDDLDMMLFELMDAYEANSNVLSVGLVEEMGDLYSRIDSCYSDLAYVDEMTLSDYNEYVDQAKGFRTECDALLQRVEEELANVPTTPTDPFNPGTPSAGTADAAAVLGQWDLSYCEMSGYSFTAEDLGYTSYYFTFNADGTGLFVYNDISAPITWTFDGSVISTSADVQLTYTDGKLKVTQSSIDLYFEKY